MASHGFELGASWSGTDPMHFELVEGLAKFGFKDY
jgi:hypothetical protein